MNHESDHPDTRTAQWSCSRIALRVDLIPRGVRRITIDNDRFPGQGCFWEELDAHHPELAGIEPYGSPLAEELRCAISGIPFERQVPWAPFREPWEIALYRHVCKLPAGKITLLPSILELDGAPFNDATMATALRTCPLVPLVPVHRVRVTPPTQLRFPWGEKWQKFLLGSESNAANTCRKGKLVPEHKQREGGRP